MAAGSSLHRVEAIGKPALILPIEEEVPGAQQQNTHSRKSNEGKLGSAQSLACRLHAAQYIPAKRRVEVDFRKLAGYPVLGGVGVGYSRLSYPRNRRR